VVDVAATIVNVSDAAVEMTGTLRIVDAAGAVVATQAAGPFTVAGGSHALALSWAGGLSAGDYTAQLELYPSSSSGRSPTEPSPSSGRSPTEPSPNSGRFPTEPITASAAFRVTSGGIVSFSGPTWVGRGEIATFSLRFRNDRPEAVDAVVGVSIYDDYGAPVADLTPQLLNVAGDGEAQATFAWTAGSAGGAYRAEALVAVGGHVYGPQSRRFLVGRQVYLPVGLKNR
jgi:hypothetical protein